MTLEIPALTCLQPASGGSISWRFTGDENDRRQSGRWCAGVGPPAIVSSSTVEVSYEKLTIVTWNIHVGAGDLERFVADLRAGRLTDGQEVKAFVLLLQEVRRTGGGAPLRLPEGAKGAAGIGPPSDARPAGDITSTARELGANVFYAPSMRNGVGAEDRGNAIISTVGLDGYAVIELPFERQRRVALAATAHLRRSDGTRVSIRVVSVHLTNAVPRRAWVFSEHGRMRQARALTKVLHDDPIVVGGDFNTWFGAWDGAYRTLTRRFDAPRTRDHRPTFSILRLDHVFMCLPDGWTMTVRRADRRYGSDHYPVIAQIAFARRPS
jgi:endonuclease/exonuclease/phosphatase family metal-dependent hydrolase